MPADRPFAHETRFAVVMYGGVSLAIYINGVAQELLSLVRATAPAGRDDDPAAPRYADGELSAVERIYREIARRVGGRRPYADPPAEHIRTRFVVDVVSGTSAGGLNGIFLAKALANGGSMQSLKKLWVDEGDIHTLLNDGPSGRGVALEGPRPDRPASLLNSQRMLAKLLYALGTMGGDPQAAEPVLADELDLFVTATDLHGLTLPLRIANGVIYENRHKSAFHFVGATTRASGAGVNDFRAGNDPFIAFAGRCTSSFPLAFEPMQLADLARLRGGLPATAPGEAMPADWLRFLGDYLRPEVELQGRTRSQQAADFMRRPFGDGGYLDNKPFSRAIDALQWRQANANVTRKLLYVEPSPEHPEATAGPRVGPRPDPFSNLVAAASTLPRVETIREDLERVLDRNERIDHVLRATRFLPHDAAVASVDVAKLWNKGTTFANSWLADGVRAYGVAYGPYFRLKLGQLTDELAEVVARVTDLDERSDDLLACRMLMSAWRQEHYDSVAPGPEALANRRARGFGPSWASENLLLMDYDLGYRLRRVAFLRDLALGLDGLEAQAPRDQSAPGGGSSPRLADERATEILMGAGLAPVGADFDATVALLREHLDVFQDELDKVRRVLGRMYLALRVSGRGLRSRSERNPLATGLRGMLVSREERAWLLEPPRPSERVRRARAVLGYGEIDGLQRPPAATSLEERRSALAAASEAARATLRKAFTDASHCFEERVPVQADLERERPVAPQERVRWLVRRCLRHYHDLFEFYDMALLPMTFGTNVGELAKVEVVRVSPEDAAGLVCEREPGAPAARLKKLAGTRVMNFGAFMDARWRRSDILWGRLDAIEILLERILPAPRHGDEEDARARERLVLRAQAAALAEDLVPLGVEEGRRVLVEAFLHTTSGRPEPEWLQRVLDRLAPVLDEQPRLRELLEPQAVLRVYAETFRADRDLPAHVQHRLMARAATVFGRVMEGVSNGENGVLSRAGRALVLAARVAWGFVECAVPGNIWQVVTKQTFQVVYLLESLLIAGGTFVRGFEPAAALGWKLLLWTALVHGGLALLSLHYTGKRTPFQRVMTVLGAVALGVLVLGIVKTPEALRDAGVALRDAAAHAAQVVRGWWS